MATFSKGIVYGNAAHMLGKHAEGDHTHTWTVYLRSPHNEVQAVDCRCCVRVCHFLLVVRVTAPISLLQDLSQFIRKVQFKLHESFQNAVRSKCAVCVRVRVRCVRVSAGASALCGVCECVVWYVRVRVRFSVPLCYVVCPPPRLCVGNALEVAGAWLLLIKADATAVDKPPYEVSESGWGEFDIQIKIFFVDSGEKPVGHHCHGRWTHYPRLSCRAAVPALKLHGLSLSVSLPPSLNVSLIMSTTVSRSR